MLASTANQVIQLERLRRRTVWSLVAGVALGSTGHIAAVTVATIVAEKLAGTSAWSGAPGATVVLGAALGATVLSWIMGRRGRRAGLVAGYGIGVLGALLATLAVIGASLPLLLAGTLLIGFGNSANQLSRYAAADLYGEARRASALGTVVWGATIGAVIGPNLAAPAGRLASGLGLPELAGAYLVPVLFVGAAGLLSFALLRPDPSALADTSSEPAGVGRRVSTAVSLAELLARPHVPIALVALVTGQVVMTLVMTMTPLHMTAHGHGLTGVGLVISAHTFGMFGLSPLSGRLADRYGSVPVIMTGLLTVAAASILAAFAPGDGGAVLFLALFLLGYGWNLGYVAGSALLTSGLRAAERTRVQGLTDALIWGSAGAASLGSGIVVAAAGYATLGLLGATLVVLPAMVVFTRRRTVTA
ncbi:MAG: MFS transporter [Candidatus Limnocylindrales bacterium]